MRPGGVIQRPWLYVDVPGLRGRSRVLRPRGGESGARVAVHYPELGRCIELEVDNEGRYWLTDRPAAGRSGPVVDLGRGRAGDTNKEES